MSELIISHYMYGSNFEYLKTIQGLFEFDPRLKSEINERSITNVDAIIDARQRTWDMRYPSDNKRANWIGGKRAEESVYQIYKEHFPDVNIESVLTGPNYAIHRYPDWGGLISYLKT